MNKNKLPQGFEDNLNTMSTDELKALIVKLQVQNEENEVFKESEPYQQELQRYDLAKERFNEMAGPVRDLTKQLKAQTKATIDRLKEKGGC